MVVAIGVAVLLLVGVPLLAWWVARRRFWSRQSAPLEPHVSRELIARHGLAPAEYALVDRAATWGREVSDDRLRAAVVDLAAQRVEAAGRRAAPAPWLVVLVVVWGAVIAGSVAFAVAQGRWGAGATSTGSPWPAGEPRPSSGGTGGPDPSARSA
ncbi:hypothetical protein ACI79C_13105 [Geodermatophilus sp. SYSU D00697]